MSGAPVRLAVGLWHWRARHPEWHPGEFGREVGSFAVDAGGVVLLVDPLLPAEPGAVLEALDDLVGDRLAIVVTIPYHVRSSEELWWRYRDRADVTIHGHPAAARRLRDPSAFRAVEPGDALPGGGIAHAIGRPRRYEMPLHLPSHRALCFGDAIVVTPEGDLRVWLPERVDVRRLRWYRERLMPTLEPLLDLDVERVLVTHGEPVLHDGHAALRAALDAEPWYHRA